MLIRQAGINLAANVTSALLGLLSVSMFTRLFSPQDYGTYLLGTGFATVVSVFLVGWFRNLALSGHARNDGTDVRGLVLAGYLLCCLAAPVAYGTGLSIGLDGTAALAAIVLAMAVGLFELSQDLLRARLESVAVLMATLVRAIAVLGLGAAVALLHPTGLALLMAAALAAVVAMLVQARQAWGGTTIMFDRARLAAVARQGLPLTVSLTRLAVSGVTDRFMIANLIVAADAGKYVAALDLVRQTLMLPRSAPRPPSFQLPCRSMRTGAMPPCGTISPIAASCCLAWPYLRRSVSP
jgi:O-antigen/teichoic acid export membrane protein